MKMITIELRVLAEDNTDAETVTKDVDFAVQYLKENDDQALQGCDWYEATFVSERDAGEQE